MAQYHTNAETWHSITKVSNNSILQNRGQTYLGLTLETMLNQTPDELERDKETYWWISLLLK